ncbi:putative peptide/nitrate transporter [Apostasia shenzhenica]|uniref:Putative peptide/nitrate transporter n=1 Tax=Apostasia shenzhenica TaxID=1088818 RepID=A0A2I0AZK9_9ASPA|nr:putative peptide/nitrate transporter [Apostasia shenzhenica]
MTTKSPAHRYPEPRRRRHVGLYHNNGIAGERSVFLLKISIFLFGEPDGKRESHLLGSSPVSNLIRSPRGMEKKAADAENPAAVAVAPPPESHSVKYSGWKTMPFLIGNETFEKLGGIATASNLLVYLTTVFHLKSIHAATILNVYNGTTSLATVLGAFVSDAYLGRYKTLGIASIVTLLGMIIIMLTAAIPALHPPPCAQGSACSGPRAAQLAVLISSFVLLVIGAGGIRPCNLAFGADQFDPHSESGKKGISSFFNWYYFTFTIAVMISSTFIIYVQSNVSWTLGLAIPAIMMLVSCAFFFLGTRIYVKVRPEGSPFTGIARVLAAAIRKRRCQLLEDSKMALFDPPHVSSLVSKLPHTNQFRNFSRINSCLDKAAIISNADEIRADGTAANPWRLCSIQQIEELKCLLRIVPIWSTGIIYYVGMAQQSTYVVLQALQSDRHLGSKGFEIPAGSFSIFSLLALTLWIPIYDRIVVPWIRKLTKKEEGITMLQRMGTGIVLSIIAMLVAGAVEEQRRRFAQHHPTVGVAPSGGAVSSFSSLWLVPQLMLSGLAEAFNTIGQMQFYYKEFPEHMRSVAGSLFFCTVAFSNYFSGLMVSLIHEMTGGEEDNWLAGDLNKGRLEYFYFLIAGIGVVNFIFFLSSAKWYKYKAIVGSSSQIPQKANISESPQA